MSIHIKFLENRVFGLRREIVRLFFRVKLFLHNRCKIERVNEIHYTEG